MVKVLGVMLGAVIAVMIVGAVYALEAVGLDFALGLMGFDISFYQAVGAVLVLNFIAMLFRPKKGEKK